MSVPSHLAPGSVLSQRALNRALLDRQMLLRRAKLAIPAAVEHLVGLQAQSPTAPYAGLWSRLDGFRFEDLAALLESRALVRVVLMRSTIHLVTADDCLTLRPVIQPVLDRGLKDTYGRRLAGVDAGRLATLGRALVEERPLSGSELGRLLQETWPNHDADALANGVRAWVPLVQIPPRGLWGAGGLATHTSAEAWLGRPLATENRPDAMLRRYLAAFGPASLKDMQLWSGLTGLREAVEKAAPRPGHLPRRERRRAVRPAGRAPPRSRRAGAATLPARVRQPPALPRRPHPRHRGRAPRRRLHQRHRAPRRLRPGNLEARSPTRGRPT